MKTLKLVTLLYIAFSLWSCNKKQAETTNNDELVLFDFEENFDKSQVKPQDATYKIVTEENTYLQVNNGFTLREAGVKLVSSKENPWDLNGFHQVKADVSNTGDEIIQVELFVGNDPDGLKRWYCSDYIDLKPGESGTITVDLAWTPWVFNPQLDIVGMRGIPGTLKTDISKIQELVFCSRYATQPNQFTIDNVRAVGKLEEKKPDNFFPFVDEFGQYKHKDWEGKMHSKEELKEAAKKGPKLKATGFFRTEKVDNKWWIVDPEGYVFWTAGLNCVASTSVFTGVSHRENYFEYLPKEDDVLNQFYGKGTHASHGFYKDKLPYKSYNFYQSNLYRKYGENWLEKFQEMAHLRIKDWGMNTIGFVSDFGATRMHKTPYVGSIWIRNTPKIEGSQGFWGKFHDVFDPNFRLAVKESVESQKEGANDPWCIGYFVARN